MTKNQDRSPHKDLLPDDKRTNAMSPMTVTLSKIKTAAVASVTGDITHAVSSDFQTSLLDALAKESNLVLDFSGIGMLTSAGLRALLLLHREAASAKKCVVFAAVPAAAQDVMKVTGFWDHFITAATVDEAVSLIERSL
jgi:anti-sigma B factor antagonist